MIHELLLFLAASALTLMALVSILNALAFPRLDARAAESELPFVSILVPARDEAPRVARTVGLLLAQAYPRFELLLLDDASTDDTADRALEAAQGDPRFRLLRGQPLPAGWIGKNWACQQLSEAARGDLLLFTDADVSWSPQALAAIAAQLSRSRADLLAVFPTQRTGSLAERLVVPLMALAVLGYLPVWAVHFIPWPVFSAANGQCLAFRRAAYERIGGHAAVHSVIVEDMALAGAIKRAGLRLRLADAAGLVTTRMYADWPGVRDGFAKNIIAGHGGVIPLLLSTLFHWTVFLLPWAWLLGGDARALSLILLGILVRALTARVTRQRIQDALLLPVSVLLMTAIAFQALAWQARGGPAWKGRSYGRVRKPLRKD